MKSFAPHLRFFVLVVFACQPDFGDRESLITEARVLAVRGEPAEAKPDEIVTYSVLVATPDGPVDGVLANWAFCATPKLLTENGSVSPRCLTDGVRVVAVGTASVTTAIPSDACSLFGPDVTAAELRPRDPDVSGGFYQPMRVNVSGIATAAFGFERIRCNLASASAEAATQFGQRYTNNRNPTVPSLEAFVGLAQVPLDRVPGGAVVTLRAKWLSEDAEPYVVLDVASQTLIDRREGMRVSWFANAGSFASDRTGRTEAEREPFTDNEWTAPNQAGIVHVFVVLRDDRGGAAFAHYPLTVMARAE